MRHSLHAICLFAAVALASPSDVRAADYHSGEFGYTVTIPDGWTQVPPAALQQMVAKTQSAGAAAQPTCDAGFQPAAHRVWLSYPYVVITVIPYDRLGIHRQVNDAEMDQAAKAIAGADVGKVLDSTLSPQARSMIGAADMGSPQLDKSVGRIVIPMHMTVPRIGLVKGVSVGYFGKESLVQVSMFAKDADWATYAPPAQALTDSFKFDPALAFSRSAAAVGFSWASVAHSAVGGAIAFGVLGVIGVAIARAARRA